MSTSNSDVLPLCEGLDKTQTVTLSDRKLVMMFRNNPGTTKTRACKELETAITWTNNMLTKKKADKPNAI